MRATILKKHLRAIQKDLTAAMKLAEMPIVGSGYSSLVASLDQAEAVLLEGIRAGYDKHIPNGNGMKTHCPNGHEYSESNTRVSGKGRQCRICRAAQASERRNRKHEEISAKQKAAWLAKKTHCPRGHPLIGANVYLDARGARRCRKCQRTIPRPQMTRSDRREASG